MRSLLALARHPGVTSWLLLSLLKWYYVEEPVRILKATVSYVRALIEAFSFGFLLRTLISPFKGIADSTKKRGFSLEKMAEALTLNVTSRVIGMIFRLVTILVGIAVILLMIVVSLGYLVLWLVFPGLLVGLPIAIL